MERIAVRLPRLLTKSRNDKKYLNKLSRHCEQSEAINSLAQQLDSLPKGSIVLIDDIETYLGVSAQRELRKFLKELGQKRDILFIVSTHSPFMIDCNHLDEVRILKPKDNGFGTEILDLENVDETDKQSIIDEIAKIVGVNYGSVVSTNKGSNGE